MSKFRVSDISNRMLNIDSSNSKPDSALEGGGGGCVGRDSSGG